MNDALAKALLCTAATTLACCGSSPQTPPPGPMPESTKGCLGFATMEDQVLYFAMVDRFADGDSTNNQKVKPGVKGAFQGGDLAGLTEKLPYLAELGVTAIWITPIVTQIAEPVTGAGFEDYGYHGYWAADFETMEPSFGTEEQLATFLDEAHARGIRVVLDVVINHPGYHSALARDAEWTRSTDTGTCPAEGAGNDINSCLFGLPDFRTEDPRVRDAVVGWQLDWVRRHPFDGFRLDTFKHVESEIFAELHTRAEALAKGEHGCNEFLAIGEWWGAKPGDDTTRRLTDEGAADTLFDFDFHGVAEGFVSGRMRAEAAAHHLNIRHQAEGPTPVHFLDTHDVPTFVYRLGDAAESRYPLAVAMHLTVWGIPLITWGDEVGRAGGEWPDNRSMMPWAAVEGDEHAQALLAMWKELIATRRAHPALQSRDFRVLTAETDSETGDATLAYSRGPAWPDLQGDDEAVLVVLRRGGGGDVTVAVPSADVKLETLVTHGEVAGATIQQGVMTVAMGDDSFGIWQVTRSTP